MKPVMLESMIYHKTVCKETISFLLNKRNLKIEHWDENIKEPANEEYESESDS